MGAGDRWRYEDRRGAGRELAAFVRRLDLPDPVVLALPRGGVPVAYEVATALGAPLDVIIVRKLAVPGNPEVGMGAITDGPAPRVFIDSATVAALRIEQGEIDAEIARQSEELERRRRAYVGDRPAPSVRQRSVVLVDDGIATGGTTRVAIEALQQVQPRKLILAVPIAPPSVLTALRPLVDDIVCLSSPKQFFAVGQAFRDFDQTTDEEVIDLLSRARDQRGAA